MNVFIHPIDRVDPGPTQPLWLPRFLRIVWIHFFSVIHAAQERRAMAQLSEFDDHLLRDIGLTREQARPGYSPLSDGRWLIEQARTHER